jgi:5-formyltetrahydrofolate cyclo-ligase
MNTGLGFSEIILIGALVLVFFGSKELPQFLREAAKLLAKVRRYSERLKSELNEITRSVEEPLKNITADKSMGTAAERKNQLRKHYISVRKDIDESLHAEHSLAIHKNLISTREFSEAPSVMIYVSTGREVATTGLIKEMLSSGKRVVVPYCMGSSADLGVAEIMDFERDLIPGELGILEPHHSLRKLFFKSDIKLIVCPGVAFDVYGGRLGRGKAYYDNFLRELKGKIPVFGLAFNCQISKEPLPFDYHDIAMDQVITESGLLLQKQTSDSAVQIVKQFPAG